MKTTSSKFLTCLGGLILLAAVAFAQGPPPGGGGAGAAGDGIWRRNAYWGEFQTFDSCMGHQPGSGDYHHHANPICLRAQLGDNIEPVRTTRTGTTFRESTGPWKHSPILGWSFDGYPIYGPYGYTDARNASSAVKRLKSGFRLRNITARTSLPDWSMPNHVGVPQQLSASQYGAPINNLFPLGRYNEDFEWAAGVGDLDQYNGRMEITPEFPQGTYAYHITIDDTGAPAFPYIFAGELYGTVSGGRAQTVANDAQEYFNSASTSASPAPVSDAAVSAWFTKDATTAARIVSGFDPSAGPVTTWPISTPAGFRTSGSVTTPTNANVQRVRYSTSTVYVNANNLASYIMGPWFDPTMTGGVFTNFPANLNYQFQFPRTPTAAATKTSVGMGPQGMWVNGVTVFNFLDGASYRNSTGGDVGGGTVRQTALQVSSASGENGPAAPGSLITAWSLFGTELATATASAPSASWPLSLGTTSVSVKDAQGTSRPAPLAYVSPTQINFRVPAETATGIATVTYTVGSTTFDAGLYVVGSYPNLFVSAAGQPAGYVTRVRNGQQLTESITAPIAVNSTDEVYLVFYGSGLGSATEAKATIGGVDASVAYAGPQGTWGGLDQFNVRVPASLARRGKVDLVVTIANRPSNTVTLELQ